MGTGRPPDAPDAPPRAAFGAAGARAEGFAGPVFPVEPASRCGGGRRDPEVYRRQARVLRALANPARLQVVDRLAEGPCTVGELTALVGLDQSTVSKHLAVLRAQGIVDDERRGNRVFYRLLTPCVLDFFACADGVLAGAGGRGGKR